jgi:hypothetical protein
MYLSQCPTNKRPVKKKSSLPFHSRMYPLFLSGLCLEASDSEGLPRTLTRLYADDPLPLFGFPYLCSLGLTSASSSGATSGSSMGTTRPNLCQIVVIDVESLSKSVVEWLVPAHCLPEDKTSSLANSIFEDLLPGRPQMCCSLTCVRCK